MSPEELSLLRDAVRLFEKPKDNLVRKALAHIDAQAQQIEALKAGWVEERAILDYIELVEGYDYGAHVVLSDDERSDAKDSLAAEHPELFGQEVRP